MVGSLTVLPAMLAWLGDRVEKGRVPLLRRPRERARGESRHVDARSSTASCASPVVVGGRRRRAVLVALAIPALGMKHASAGRRRPAAATSGDADLRPRSQAAFPGERHRRPTVVVEADERQRRRGDAARSTSSERAAVDAASSAEPGRGRRQPGRDRRAGRRSRWPATARTTASKPGAADAARRHRPGDGRAGAGGARPTSPAPRRQSVDFNDLMQSRAAVRVRRSCWRWRSCCCW